MVKAGSVCDMSEGIKNEERMQVPVHVRNQIKSLELLGYQSDRKRISLREINSTSKQQHEARKATAGAA